MSFQTSIAGACPSNSFVFTTTNVSADNISCTNLSATNASIVSLTTTTFSPVNINTSLILADDIHASNISVTTINSSLSTTQDLIATSGTINTFYSGFIEAVGAIITDIHSDLVIADHIHVSNISLDGTLGGHTANLVQLNAQNIDAIVTDSFYVNASQINVVETINVCTVNCSNVIASGNISATTLTGRIDGNLAAGQGIALTQVGNVTTISNTGIVTDPLSISTLNASTVNSSHIYNSSIITTTGLITSTIHSSVIHCEQRLDVENVCLFNGIVGQAGTFIICPEIASVSIRADDINISSVANISNLNVQTQLTAGNSSFINISASGAISTQSIDATSIDATSIHCTGQTLTAILSSDIINSNYEMYINDRNGTTAKTQIHRLTDSYEMFNPTTAGPYKFYTGVNVGTPQLEINSSGIKADISQNIQAGTGISLSTVGGITTIGNTAQTSDPLDLNTLNASSINSSNINNASVITTFDLNATNVGATLVAAGDVVASTATAATTNTSTFNGSTINSSHIYNSSTITTDGLVTSTIHSSVIHCEQRLDVENVCLFNGIVGQTGTFIICPEIASVSIRADDINISSVANISNLNVQTQIIASNASFSNISSSGAITATSLSADISPNLLAGNGISLSTTNGVTTIGNTGTVTDPLNLNTLNSSNVNSSHIYNSSVITTAALISDTIHASGITSSQTITANNISASGNIIASTLTADISSNLAAAAGVSLSTTNGITTISSDALSTSTQYCFQATGSVGNTTISAGEYGRVNFNTVQINEGGGYNTGSRAYYIQSAGYYSFGFKIYFNSATTGQVRFGIYKNGALLGFGGAYAATGESLDLINYCNVGDYITVECAVGSAIIYVAPSHSWFYGHKLQPENNTVSVTTDLSVSTLTAALVGATDVVSTTATAGFMNTSILNSSTVNGDISNNLDEGNNINLVTVAGVTTINAQIPSSYTNLSITNLSSTAITSQDINTSNASIDNAIVTSITSTDTSYFTNISISQTFDMAPGSAFKISNSTGSELFFYNDATQFNYGTIAGNTGNINFGSGYNASTIQITGLNVVNMENAAGVNISNTSINNASITTAEIVNLSSPLVGASRYYARRQTSEKTPGDFNQLYYQDYDTLAADSAYVSWATPNLATGGANTGFLIQVAGIYRIEFTFNAHSVSFNNRVNWFTKLYKNGSTFDANQYVTFTYTRGDNTSFSQWSTANTFCIVTLAVNDYIHTVTSVAKNSPIHNNNWEGLRAAWGATCSFEYLGT